MNNKQPMRIFGIDFTSAPNRRKPIACACCRFSNVRLVVEDIQCWQRFDEFETFLNAPGEWVAAIDAPLGQPRRLVEDLRWPSDWAGYVGIVGAMTKDEFVELITSYCHSQPAGSKHHLRETDRLAQSCSPMMLYGVPVGKMFFEAAPRILKADVALQPCRPNESGRVVVEAYPAMMARRAIGNKSYKNDSHRKGAALAALRLEIIEYYQTNENEVGIELEISQDLRAAIVAQSSGDRLDAVLCALQVAAASTRHDDSWGVPQHADALEGWIVDPGLNHSS